MAVNKVEINGEVKLDLTGDTVTADTLAEGYTAHNAAGEVITGTMAGGGSGGDADASFIAYIESDAGAGITELPSKLKKIGSYAFQNCSRLALTSLPSGLTSIGNSAFEYCGKLALTSLPSGLTSIGSSAFQGFTGLTSLTFKGTPNKIVSTAFNNCTNLTEIKVPWAEGAVANAPWGATNATITYNYTGD